MEKLFVVKDDVGTVKSNFRISVSKVKGVEYKLIWGEEPCWEDVVLAMTFVFAKMRIPSREGPYFLKHSYEIKPDNTIDCRFSPVLCDLDRDSEYKLPVTIDYSEIMEHYFYVPFITALRIMLALTMSYNPRVLAIDTKKIINVRAQKLFSTVIEFE